MIKKKAILACVFVLLFTFSSCNKNNSHEHLVHSVFFENNKLKRHELKIMDNLYFEQYYSNGFIRQKGIISNSVLNGYSIEYSIDSMIVWSGLYKNGKRVYPDTLNFSPMNFNLFIDAKTYCIDSTPILFKIITPYHPNDITPFATNCKFTWHEESNTYKIEPTDTGFIKIGMMKWFDENPITIYIDSIFVTDNSNTSKNLEE